MESIDVHFHIAPPDFVEAVRQKTFAEAVQVAPWNGRDYLVGPPPSTTSPPSRTP